MVVECLWRLCNKAFERGVVSKDLRFVPLNKGKGEITECKNYRALSGSSVVEKYMLEY